MASRLLRRSGVAVGLEADRLKWIPDLIIQVGVGFHYQGMLVLKEEWPEVDIIGFEAHPSIYEDIKSEYPGKLLPYTISNKVGLDDFYEKRRHKDGSSVFSFKDTETQRYIGKVPTTTLDTIIGDIKDRKSLLWLDCEGSELRALQGATRILKDVGMVNVEMTPRPPSDHWAHPNDIHDKLRESGFYRSWLHTMKGGQYDAIYTKPHIFKKELCCCPYTVKEFEKEQE